MATITSTRNLHIAIIGRGRNAVKAEVTNPLISSETRKYGGKRELRMVRRLARKVRVAELKASRRGALTVSPKAL